MTALTERSNALDRTSEPLTVVVTSAGSAPAVAVIQALRQQQELPVRVVAADMDRLSVGFHLADESALIPAANDPTYIERLWAVCNDRGASVLFPIIDEELQIVADAAPHFRSRGVAVVTNSPEVVRTAKDKWLTYQWCRRHGFRTPQTWLPESRPSDLTFPVIVKPRAGRGSEGVAVVRCEPELGYNLLRDPRLLIQERVEGPEFTIDILMNDAGRVLSAVPRERLLTKAGMCVKGRTVRRTQLLELTEQIAEQFGLAPRGNIQLIQSRKDGEYHLIELNPKFGAGLPLTTAAGVNMPLLILKQLLGETVPPFIGQFQSDLVMLRHWAEVFAPAETLLQA